MGRPPRRRTSRWSRLPRSVRIIVTYGSAIGAIAGAIVAVAKSWEYIEPYWVASHGYVNEKIVDVKTSQKTSHDQTNYVLRDMQIDYARGKREATTEAIAKWQLDLSKPDNNDTSRNLINDRLRTLTDTRENLDRQIRSLERAKAQEH